MNHIYRIIWSKTKQCYVVVSEVAKANGKNKSKAIKAAAAVAMATVAATSVAGVANAADATITAAATSPSDAGIAITSNGLASVSANSRGTGAPINVIYIGNNQTPTGIGDEDILIGYHMTGNSAGHAGDTLIGNRIRSGGGGNDSLATAVGYAAQVSGPSVSIGVGSSTDIGDANGPSAVAQGAVGIGAFARTSGSANGGVAVGAITSADQTNSTAIGTLSGVTTLGYDREVAGAGNGGVATAGLNIQEANGNTLTSIGAKAGARTTGGIAVGSNATTSRISGNNAIAMGTNSAAVKSGSVAIGNEALGGAYKQSDDFNTLRAQQRNYQNITNGQRTRLLAKLVAANANPSAENKFQLASALAYLDRAQLAVNRATVDITQAVASVESATPQETTNAIAIGNQARAVSTNAMAAGANAIARGSNSTATGVNAQAMGPGAIASGNGAIAGMTEAAAKTYQEYVTASKAYTAAANTLASATENYNYTLGNLGAAATTALTTDKVDVNDFAAVAATTDSNLAGLRTAANQVIAAQTALDTARETFNTTRTAANNVASSNNAVAIGTSSLAAASGSVAIGNNAEAPLTGTSNAGVAVGDNSRAGDGGTAVGQRAEAVLSNTVAIGVAAKAGSRDNYNAADVNHGYGAIAIGYNTYAKDGGTIAIGSEASGRSANAHGLYAMAIGAGSAVGSFDSTGKLTTPDPGTINTASNNSMAVGYIARVDDALAAMAMGPNARVNKNATYGVAISNASVGKNAKSGIAMGAISSVGDNAVGGVAIGANASVAGNSDASKAQSARGVALGAHSEVTDGIRTGFNPAAQQTTDSYTGGFANNENTATESFTPTDTRLNQYAGLTGKALKSTLAPVSVGSATNTRQINHVAAGYADDDAVNVAQLRSVNLKIAGNTVANAAPTTGVASRADVLLDNQTLRVISDNTNLLTTDATNNTITITPKTATVTVPNDPNASNYGAAVAPTTNGLVTATDLATALNDVHWNIQADKDANSTSAEVSGSTNAAVKAGNKVNLIAGNNIKIVQDSKDGVNNFTFSVKDVVTSITSDGTQVFNGGKNTHVTHYDDKSISYDLDPDISITSVTTTGGAVLEDKKLSGLDDHLPDQKGDAASGVVNKPTTLAGDALHQAATVNDVLNSGWNLQNNGDQKDFVKPYDKVNFVDGGNTRAVVTTNDDGTKSDVAVNVSGLPITFVDADGDVVTKVGDKFVKVDADGNPTDEEAVGTLSTKLVNPSDAGSDVTGDATQLGNVAAGANTIAYDADGNELVKVGDDYYKTSDVGDDGKVVANAQTQTAVAPNAATEPAKAARAGLANFDKSDENNALTVADARNMGWVVSSDNTLTDKATGASTVGTAYADAVKNANQVHFQGTGMATVSGSTIDGIRTINVDVDAQKTVEAAQNPVVYTNAAGDKLTKIGDKFYPAKDVPANAVINNGKAYPAGTVIINGKAYPAGTTTDSSGNPVDASGAAATALPDTAGVASIDNGDVIASMNNAAGSTTTPMALSNVGAGTNTIGYDADGNQLVNVDGKYYKPSDITNGRPNEGATEVTPATNPTTVQKATAGLADLTNSNPTNALTVADARNMGWVVSASTNGADPSYADKVTNAKEVRFNGINGITVTGETAANDGVRTINIGLDTASGQVIPTNEDANAAPNGSTGNIVNANGTKTPVVKADDGKWYPASTVQDGKAPEGIKPIDTSKDNVVPDKAAGASFVTGNQVGDAIQASGWTVGKAAMTTETAADKVETLTGDKVEKVNPNDNIRFADGANVTQTLKTVTATDATGKTVTTTYVQANVTGLPITYTTADGTPVTKVGDTFYKVDDKGNPTAKVVQPADLKTNLVNPAAVGTNKTGNATQLGNVAAGANTFPAVDKAGNKLVKVGDSYYPAGTVEINGKAYPAGTTAEQVKAGTATEATPSKETPLAMANDGKWYDATKVNPNGTPAADATPADNPPAKVGTSGLVDFSNSNPTNAATVKDLQNMGFVVSTSDTGYEDQVRNANKVDFKAGDGIEVKGETTSDGTRQITIGLKKGEVVATDKDGKNTGTVNTGTAEKPNLVNVVKANDGKWYPADQVTTTTDPDTGKSIVKPNKDATAVDEAKTPVTNTNVGGGFVTGNQVGDAIQSSGWTVGKDTEANMLKGDGKSLTENGPTEKVNPDDNVRFVDSTNITQNVRTVTQLDENGKEVTTTFIQPELKPNVTLGGAAVDKDGNALVKVGDKYYKPADVENGKAKDGATPVEAAKPATNGSLTVKSENGNTGVDVTVTPDGKGQVSISGPTYTEVQKDKDGNDVTVTKTAKADISVDRGPASLDNMPDAAVRAIDPKTGVYAWFNPSDVTTKTDEKGNTTTTVNADAKPITNAMDRISYVDSNGTGHDVATMDDGLKFTGDDGSVISKPLNSTVSFTGGNRTTKDAAGNTISAPLAKADTTTGNIGVFNDNGKMSVQLAKDLKGMSSTEYITPATENSPAATTVVNGSGMTIRTAGSTAAPVSVTVDGISAGGKTIQNVAAGVNDTDAVNVSQLRGMGDNILNQANDRIDRVGAQAAALGALKTIQYDPLEPTQFMAGYGYYKGKSAFALGLAHYKNESTLFHAGASMSGSHNDLMANAGVTWKFGSRSDETSVKDTFRQGPISASYTLQDKVSALEAQNTAQKEEINDLRAQLQEVLRRLDNK